MKWRNKLNKIIGTLVLAASVVCFSQLNVNAESVNADGVSYNDEVTVSVQYVSDYAYGGGAYTYIDLDNEEERIGNVKSSSKNLLAKKTYESYYTSTDKDYDYETDTYTTKTTNRIYSTYISFFAKKAGTYTVTFDVIGTDGNVRCTKKIKVKTGAASTTGVSPIKSITYAGKDLYNHYPYATKTSGKLSVKANKNFKITKIEVGNVNAKGDRVYKTVKNNAVIKLAKKTKYSYDYSYGKHEYDELFPETSIMVSWKNQKTKETGTYYYSLCTLNKK